MDITGFPLELRVAELLEKMDYFVAHIYAGESQPQFKVNLHLIKRYLLVMLLTFLERYRDVSTHSLGRTGKLFTFLEFETVRVAIQPAIVPS